MFYGITLKEGATCLANGPVSACGFETSEVFLGVLMTWESSYETPEVWERQEIGERLFITERTVRFDATSIFNRLGADDRAQAVAIANRLGLF